MTCLTCERYKQSAIRWRNEAYKASGHPLPWEPEQLWQGLTEENFSAINSSCSTKLEAAACAESILKEKNG